MKYFELKLSWEPQIIGVRNGVTQVVLDEKKYDKHSYERMRAFFFGIGWEYREKIPDFHVLIHYNVLKGAKITDFLQFSPSFIGCPFLIHEKVAEVFLKFKFQDYYLYPANIYEKDKLINDSYKLFYSPLQGFDIVNFEKSIFYTGSDLLGKKYYNFDNEEIYKKFVSNASALLKIEKMMLSKSFDTSLDFFKGKLGRLYVSEGLKDAIEILGFTGIKVVEAKDPEVVVL